MEVHESPEIYPMLNCNEKPDFASAEETNDEVGDVTDEDDNCEEEMSSDYNQQLRDRIIMLRATLYDLKKQLKEEREGWQREIQYISTIPANAYAENLRRNLTYEEINQLHQESKAALQRQLAITNYKRRLLEVESMCNVELMRVKQSVMFLQPLQMMISEWNTENGTSNFIEQPGDLSLRSSKDELSDMELKSSSTNIPLEMISTKLYNDMNDMFNVLSAHCQETIPNWNQDNSLQSQSSTVFSDCGQNEIM